MGPTESRLGIDSTLTRHFLADSYTILLEESGLGLARTQKVSLVMGPSEDSASTRLWLGIFWPTRTRFFWKSQDSDSIGLDFLRLGLARTRLFPARPITSQYIQSSSIQCAHQPIYSQSVFVMRFRFTTSTNIVSNI